MPNILKQYTKFVFPFQYEQGLVSPQKAKIENKKGVKLDVFEPFSVRTESLREGIELLLSQDGGKTKIADCYRLNINCRRSFLLPPKKNETLDFVDRQTDSSASKVAITDVKVYLFESSVGFFEVEVEYSAKEIPEYISLNYFICEAKSDKNYFVYHEKVWDPDTKTNEIKDVTFTMGELIGNVLGSMSDTADAVKFVYQKSKPIIYSHLLVDEKPDDFNELLQHLSKNYKQSYKFDDSCTKIKTFHPFENSYWTSSLNGTVNISFLTDDDTTNEFFANNFYTKTRDTYYFLFLNILHQRYAINRVMGKMGDLDRLSNDYFVMEDELKLARQYEAEAINLKFRAFFKYPSTVEHMNGYYDMLYDAFQVAPLYDSFSSDIKSLQSICEKYVDRIKVRDDKLRKRKNAKMEIFISIFGALVAEVTLLNNSWALIEKVVGRSLSLWSPVMLILMGTLLSPLITIVFNVSKTTNDIKQLSNEINSEKKDHLVEDDKQRRRNGKKIAKLRKKGESSVLPKEN